jgi:hypothetical protein
MRGIVERYITNQRQQIVATFENWWDKYKVTLTEMPFCNPSSSSSDRRPLVDSQLICCFTQCANNSGCGPIHRAIRRYAVDHQIAEGIGLGKLRRQTTGLIHVLRPASQLLKVLIDATVGRHQGLLRVRAERKLTPF